MLVFIFFLPIILIMPLSLHYMYLAAAQKNFQGMLLLVHIPKEYQDDTALQSILSEYQKKIKRLTLLFLIGGLSVLLLNFVPLARNYIGLLFAGLFVLLFLPLYCYSKTLQNYRQKLLALKATWNLPPCEEKKLVQADLATSRLKNVRTPKSYWFALPMLLSLAIYLLVPQANPDGLRILLFSNLFIHLLCFGLHIAISHNPAKMYSTDKEVNIALNQEYRRSWSLSYLGLSFLQVILMLGTALLFLPSTYQTGIATPISLSVFLLLFALIPVLLFGFAYWKNRQKEQSLLNPSVLPNSADSSDSYYVWDGIFGFVYNNPDNPAILVNKPIGIGQSLNVGHPKGKLWYQLLKVISIGVVLFAVFLVCFEEAVSPVLQANENQIRIERTLYPFSISAGEIESIERIDEIPILLNVAKNVGTASARLLRGSFSGKGLPNTQLYLFRNVKPYIHITLTGSTRESLLFNYENPEQTEQLWQYLQTIFPEKMHKPTDTSVDTTTPDTTESTETPYPQVEHSTSETLQSQRKYIGDTEQDFSLPAGNGTLHAVVNLPESVDAPIPLVLFIGGSGPSTKEGMANINLDFAAYFTANGIAMLRYDERGVGKSASVFDIYNKEAELTIEDFVHDVILLIQKAKADSRFSSIYLAGHSEGALIATLATQTEKIDGILSLAGAGRNIGDITMEQLQANPFNPKDLLESAQNIVDSLKQGNHVAEVPSILQALFRPSVQPYLISWMKYDPAKELGKLVDTPVLILQGDNDMQISTVDAELLHQALPNSSLQIFPKMTHMLKNSDISKDSIYQSTQNAQEYSKVYQDDRIPLNPDALQMITDWILR